MKHNSKSLKVPIELETLLLDVSNQYKAVIGDNRFSKTAAGRVLGRELKGRIRVRRDGKVEII